MLRPWGALGRRCVGHDWYDGAPLGDQVPKLWTRDPDWGGGKKARFLRETSAEYRAGRRAPFPPAHKWASPSKWMPAESQTRAGRGRVVLVDRTTVLRNPVVRPRCDSVASVGNADEATANSSSLPPALARSNSF